MNRRVMCSILLGSTASLLVTGCASTAPPPAADDARLPTRHHRNGAQERPVFSEPTGVIALQDALALALQRNAMLEGFSYDVRAAEARMLQARLLPNPMLKLEVEEYNRNGEGFDSSESAIVLGQRIEWGGKRHWRMRKAAAEGALAGWDYETKRNDVLATTVQRAVATVVAQRRLDIAMATIEVAKKTQRVVRDRIEVGKEPPLQASKATAQLEMTQSALSKAKSDVRVAKRRLAAMWGSDQPRFDSVTGELDELPAVLPSLEALYAGLPLSPAIARWDAELRLREAALSSAKATRLPDLKAMVGFHRYQEDASDSVSLGVSFDLPLFDRNQGNVAAANLAVASAASERRAIETALRLELAEAHAALTSAHEKARIYRARVVPAMEEACAGAEEGYSRGKFDFLDMLDAQRGLFEAKAGLVDALSAHHTARADIQRIVGIEEQTNQKKEKRDE